MRLEQSRLEVAVLAELAVQMKDALRARAHARLQPRMPALPPLLIHHPFAAQAARGAHRAGALLTRGLAVHLGLSRQGPAGPCNAAGAQQLLEQGVWLGGWEAWRMGGLDEAVSFLEWECFFLQAGSPINQERRG